ncbi:MAG: glutamate synthase-related protein [Acidimicrobiia bacterium]
MTGYLLLAIAAVVVLVLGLIALYDLTQRKHAVLRVFPIIGHLRYLLEGIGPELRQYIVTDNDSERPFSRDERRWVYTSAKARDTYFGFGTDNDIERSPGYVIIKQAAFPATDAPQFGAGAQHWLPMAKVLGRARGRVHQRRLNSVVNISSMSYGSLSSAAVTALNRGAALAECVQGSGEGGVTSYHRHGGELIWQIGTGYFGCRDAQGRFDHDAFHRTLAENPQIVGVEIKLSQGAKPGLGGVLPAPKVTREIAAIRGVAVGVDCVSPAGHSAFHDADSLLDFVEHVAEDTGLPVGIKSAVGDLAFFEQLAHHMQPRTRGVDWITIDGGEGGTGAAPLAFADYVALPFMLGFARVYATFARAGLTDDVVFLGAGRLGLPQRALQAMALGCDGVNVGREAMLAIGCIQAQRCHTGRCPTGVTTNQPWRMRGLDPADKSVRCATYIGQLRKELTQLARACGVAHPALVTAEQFEQLDDGLRARTLREIVGYEPGWGRPSAVDVAALFSLAAPTPGGE